MEASESDKIFENPRIKIYAKDKGDHILLKFAGELNIYTTKPVKEQIIKSLSKTAQLVINLSKIGEFDSAGFQLLLMAKREAQKIKKKLRLISHSASVLSVLDIYGAVGLFGDQVVVPAKVRENFLFTYGLKRQKLFPGEVK